jgi:DNA-binding PucR family transcriptional regulator
MTVTVAKCLELPSFKDAFVAGGKSGLTKIVSSVSVLEYAEDPAVLGDALFVGNEFIITAFTSIKDDVDMQCRVLRHLNKQGVVAVAIYYVGVFVPKIDDGLIKASNELNLPLIIMPQGRLDYRYGEAISEIMQSIVHSQLQDSFFVPTMIENISQLPEHQRTVGNLLRMISNRLHCTLVAVDKDFQVAGAAAWPSAAVIDYETLVYACRDQMVKSNQSFIEKVQALDADGASRLYSLQIVDATETYVLIAHDADSENMFSEYVLQQIIEVLHLFMNISNYRYRSKDANALVQAILSADTYLMNEIAGQTGINVKSIQTMWLLIDSAMKKDTISEFMKASWSLRAKKYLLERYKEAVIGSSDDIIVMFMGVTVLEDYEETAAEDFMDAFSEESEDGILLCFPRISSASEARELYVAAQEYWYTLKTIFPNKRIYSVNELRFAQRCQEIFKNGEVEIKQSLAPIDILTSSDQPDDLLQTLSVYLLDAQNNVAQTAAMIYVHPGTVKYRLKIIKQKLHRDISKLPDVYELYLAVAMNRFLAQQKI